MPTWGAEGSEIEIPGEIRTAAPSQCPRAMTIFTVHWSKDGGSDETHRISPVVAVAKPANSKRPDTGFGLPIAGAASSRQANSTNCSTKPATPVSYSPPLCGSPGRCEVSEVRRWRCDG